MTEEDRIRGGRVLVVDDHPLTREGLSLAARAAMPGVAIVGAGTAAEAAAAAKRGDWRMILLDYRLPDAHGFSALLALQLHAPEVPVVLVTATEEPKYIEAARALGASGYIFKSLSLDELSRRLRLVDDGHMVFPPTEDRADVRDLKARIDALSPAQRVVLLALFDGRSNKEIARSLKVTEATVKAHLTATYRKLQVGNRTQALLAIRSIMGA